MRLGVLLFSALVFAAFAGCRGSGGLSSTPALPQDAGAGPRVLSGVVHGNFTEYALPSGANPSTFTKGPYSTLWFGANIGATYGNGFHIYEFVNSTGAVHTFSKGAPWTLVSNVLTAGGQMNFFALNTTGPGEAPEYLSHATSSGTIVIGPQVASDEEIGTMVYGVDGKLWFPDCVQTCSDETNGGIRSVSVSGAPGIWTSLPNFDANQMTPGPGGYMYVTAIYTNALPGPPPTDDSRVFVLTVSGTIHDHFVLPHGSIPSGIAVGSDQNLWVTEPGINKIARINPYTRAITQFNVPTAGAQASHISPGADTATWFTETHGNKIGRIATNGTIMEWPIPTANAGATAINYCYTDAASCPPHGGVWFTETTANKMGKFISPQ